MSAVRAAGQRVQVVDPAHRLWGKVGSVAFFVGDNVYVTFEDLSWAPTRMFFIDQLGPARAGQQRKASDWTKLLRRLRRAVRRRQSGESPTGS
jgi:hypothetical protein